MAEKQTLSIFKRTAAEQTPDNADLDEGRTVAIGIGLKQGEVLALDIISDEVDISRNSILHLAIRQFIIAYRAGQVDLSSMVIEPIHKKKRLKLPR